MKSMNFVTVPILRRAILKDRGGEAVAVEPLLAQGFPGSTAWYPENQGPCAFWESGRAVRREKRGLRK